jgi:hypothetical protein
MLFNVRSTSNGLSFTGLWLMDRGRRRFEYIKGSLKDIADSEIGPT